MSTAVYGSLCLLVAASRPPAVRAMVYTGGILLISGIAASRLALRLHAPAEVGAGLIIGMAAVAGFRIMLPKKPTVTLAVHRLTGVALVLVALLHGRVWPAEEALRDFAGFFRLFAPTCS